MTAAAAIAAVADIKIGEGGVGDLGCDGRSMKFILGWLLPPVVRLLRRTTVRVMARDCCGHGDFKGGR